MREARSGPTVIPMRLRQGPRSKQHYDVACMILIITAVVGLGSLIVTEFLRPF